MGVGAFNQKLSEVDTKRYANNTQHRTEGRRKGIRTEDSWRLLPEWSAHQSFIPSQPSHQCTGHTVV